MWRKVPLKRMMQEIPHKSLSGTEQLYMLSKERGLVPRASSDGVSEASTYIGYRKFEPYDLVMNKMQAWNGVFGYATKPGIVSPDYAVFRVTDQSLLEIRFLNYLVRTPVMIQSFAADSRGIGTGFNRLHPEQFLSTRASLPPLDVQRRIADFLDDQVRLMDGIVGCRQEQARLLAMRYESFLLDQLGFPSMQQPQENGIQYGNTSLAAGIASVSAPSAWKRVRFKSVVHRSSKVRGSSDIPLLSLASAGFLRPRSDDQQPPAKESLPRYLVVEPDDLVINPMWLTGGGLAVSSSFGAVSPDYRVFQVGPLAEPRFLHHLLRCRPYRDQYLLYTRANTTFDRRVAQVDIDSLPLSLPPLAAQRQIAEECDLEDGRYRSTTARMEAQNSLLQERKRSLITAAVTGEFDVSSASARSAGVALSGVGGAG